MTRRSDSAAAFLASSGPALLRHARPDPHPGHARRRPLHQFAESGEARQPGLDGLMACIYWTRAVQYFGHRHFRPSAQLQRTGPAAGDHDHARSPSDSRLPVRRQLSGPRAAERRRQPTRAIRSDGVRHPAQSRQLAPLLRSRLHLLHRVARTIEKAAASLSNAVRRFPTRIPS